MVKSIQTGKDIQKSIRLNVRENVLVKKSKINGTSKYFGVRLIKTESNKKWRATITINKKQNYIGVFKTEIEAAKAYDNFVKENIPYKIPLNFPEESAINS